MDNQRYASICTELRVLIKYGLSASNALANKEAPLDREYYADRIFSKLLCHAITLSRIIPTGLSPLKQGQTELWDISSASALTRALIEAFDALDYISIAEISDQERRFRILLWKLHAGERRSKMLELIGSASPELTEIRENTVELRNQLMKDNLFTKLDNGKQKNIRNGNAPAYHLSHAERNKRASVDHEYYNSCIIFLSSYVHTHPLSIHQLMEFRAGEEESLRLMSMPIQYAVGFLAKGIEGIRTVFGNRLPGMTTEESDLCFIWTEILKNGISKVI